MKRILLILILLTSMNLYASEDVKINEKMIVESDGDIKIVDTANLYTEASESLNIQTNVNIDDDGQIMFENSGTLQLNGIISQIAFFDEALTDAEHLAYYNGNVTVIELSGITVSGLAA